MHRRALLGGLAAICCGAAVPRAETPSPPTADLALLEPLYAVNASRAGLTLRVASRGCTTKADFSFYVDRRSTVPTIVFGRKRVDACKADRVGGVDLAFSYAELGLSPEEPVVVLNPVVTAPLPFFRKRKKGFSTLPARPVRPGRS
jgi:hypothetical protein